jgi:hypothetical protein
MQNQSITELLHELKYNGLRNQLSREGRSFEESSKQSGFHSQSIQASHFADGLYLVLS